MGLGHIGKGARARPSVRGKGLDAVVVEPPELLRLARPSVEHHLVVVARDRDQATRCLEGDEFLDDLARGRAAVDVVPERDDQVLGLGRDGGEERLERDDAAVNVADRQDAHSRGP